MLRGGGSAWWKDPVVTQAQANAKSTARPFDPRKFTLYELDSRPQNLTFEDDRFSADDPSGHVSQWAVATENGFAARVDKETELNGKPSVRIDCSVVDPPGFASIYQIFSAKDYRNKRVRLSGYLKAKAVKDWGALFMQVDAPDRILAFDAMEERPVKGTSDWTKVAVVLDVPPKSTKIKIGFLQAGGGTSWLSNCAFDIVDSALSTTGKPVVDDRFPPLKLPLKPDLNIE
jgi:hypothetical protein